MRRSEDLILQSSNLSSGIRANITLILKLEDLLLWDATSVHWL